MDRDPLFCHSCRDMLKNSGVRPVRLPSRSPNLVRQGACYRMNGRLPFEAVFGLRRGDVVEVEVHGFYYAVGGDDELTSATGEAVTAWRSLLKPWQLACCRGTLDSAPEWVMGMSSSPGEPEHVAALRVLSELTGIDPESLVCPPSYSHHESTRASQIANAAKPLRMFHFCCGKHLAVAHACAQRGRNRLTCAGHDSNFHVRLSAFLQPRIREPTSWTTDGCGLPTLISSVRGFARLWHQLAHACGPELARLKQLWQQQPFLVGGTDRIDTTVMTLGDGVVLAKEGADGLLDLQTLELNPAKRFTLLLKLAQRAPDDILAMALISVLEKHYEQLPDSLHAVLAGLSQSAFSMASRCNLLI